MSGIATATTVMLALMALSGAVGALLDFAYAGAIDDFLGGDGSLQDAIDAEDARNGFVLISLAAQVATAVVFLVWQARVRRNSDALGAGPHRYGHALSVGCWFIPFANLVMPKIVLNDLWRATDPQTPSAYRIEGRPVGSVVNWWWALWIVGGALGGGFALQDPGDTLADLENFAGTVRIGGVLSLVGVAAAVLGIMVVRRITQRQQQRARLFGLPES